MIYTYRLYCNKYFINSLRAACHTGDTADFHSAQGDSAGWCHAVDYQTISE
ncbi:hypothetical protein J6590_095035 [Homalodisca vitripennis]|nr:hypothetical protein J6590_095035 [Homalodisca vitripennis]